MAASTRHHKRRVVIGAVVCLVLAGGAAAALVARKPATKAAGAPPSIFKTATVKTGDLTTTESVDGAVQLSSTLTVLHRIEGQTSSSVVPATQDHFAVAVARLFDGTVLPESTSPAAAPRSPPSETKNTDPTPTLGFEGEEEVPYD
jgi:hypothetical protein